MAFHKGFVTPYNDETLTSWLYRISYQRKLRGFVREAVLPTMEITWGGPIIQSADFDFDFSSSFFHSACDYLELNPNELKVYFAPENTRRVVDYPRRTLFCKKCLVSDIASGQLPGWRKSWCYRDSTYCLFHRELLNQLTHQPAASKSWDAFLQGVYGNFPKESRELENFIRLLCILSSRVASRKRECSKDDYELFDKLFDIFLMARTLRHSAGVAYRVFGSRPQAKVGRLTAYNESVLYGAETSDARSRCGGLILTAYLLGLINECEIILLQTAAKAINLSFPGSSEIVKALYFGCERVEDYEFLHEFLGVFNRPVNSKIDDLFCRLETHGARYFFRGLKFGRI